MCCCEAKMESYLSKIATKHLETAKVAFRQHRFIMFCIFNLVIVYAQTKYDGNLLFCSHFRFYFDFRWPLVCQEDNGIT